MKKILKCAFVNLLIAMVGGFTSVYAQATGDSFATALKNKSANLVYIYSEAPGFAAEKGGKVEGVTVDVMRDFEAFLLDKYGITVQSTINKQHANNFTTYLSAVKRSSGGVFGLSNTTITEARKRAYTFSPSYISNIAMLLTHKDVPTLGSLQQIAEAFKGKTAITIKETTNEDEILKIKAKYMPALKIEYVNYFDEAMVKISNSTDYFTNVDFTYYLNALNTKKPVKRHPVGDNATEEFGIIMPKNSDWVEPFNEFLNEDYQTGSNYRKIIATHLGPNALQLLDAITLSK
ncbi:hypothetical protein GCM10011506_41180 [Marivirga lumbricoides]|uniref:Serine/threonine protein kinase n=1 Tax=Marivirga lumbricoides TaxID=1046115 RepID=A0A2T4DSA0_9BACT|nr:serine/threonine protein kinase [Marivirga lumbricoides]GGC51201.1 hypothetical protein GCM10011506_41180 [Marivirga lumbricoides]